MSERNEDSAGPEISDTHQGPGGRMFYGSVTVGERGQIVIPARARRDHDIAPGDKLIVLGSPDGLALMGADRLLDLLGDTTALAEQVRRAGRA
ncbi:AbrB/MazE/SpoVT family DNA-binding domain-containing protein [Microbacterium sp.]|uniref:AbrB/MazE/SpoVT family DNA-binding domain-containing protein n=1 Tax=Microbacterium sp. TaxID=51671 RepID=UPI0027338A4E|nr:AbrB/MazE/SpoVT family DNA-binding domain-containing protein [Microbacterium sp.]MDP3949492.1 AbrB/MazE/SpoVT family DNA-binding domain-containing protein [Microbacterium sp.]